MKIIFIIFIITALMLVLAIPIIIVIEFYLGIRKKNKIKHPFLEAFLVSFVLAVCAALTLWFHEPVEHVSAIIYILAIKVLPVSLFTGLIIALIYARLKRPIFTGRD